MSQLNSRSKSLVILAILWLSFGLSFSTPVVVGQDEIPATEYEAIAWMERERNTVKQNENGDVVEIIIDYVPGHFVVGDLEVFPKLEVLEINYTGQFYDHHMSGIAKLKNLKKFVVDYCDEISEASLSVLHYLPKLEEVKLRNCEAVFSLESLAACKKLTKLDIGSNEHLDFKALGGLMRLTKLETLVLTDNETLEDEHLALLANIPTLKHLDVSRCSAITDDGLAALGTLGLVSIDASRCPQIEGKCFAGFENTDLEILKLSDSGFNNEGLKGLAKFKQLKRLDLYDTKVTEGLAVLGEFKNLEELWASRLAVTNEDLKTMDGITTLKKLILNGCTKISGTGLAHLTDSVGLERLSLKGCRRFDAVEDFEQIAKFVNLKQLNIAETRMRPECVSLLVDLKTLERIDMSGCKWVDDASVKLIAGIESIKRITLKDVARLTDDALLALGSMKKLERLTVGKNRNITGTGLSAFAGQSGLKTLELEELAKLSPKGLKALTAMLNLEDLDISGVKLTNEHLMAMNGIPNLQSVELDDIDGVDEAVRRSFYASLPKYDN